MKKCLEKQIRIFPLNKLAEYENMPYQVIQRKLFQEQFQNNDGDFYFYSARTKMNTARGSLVLFQYGTEIIASANIADTIVFDSPQDKYEGKYVFDTGSVRVFRPIVFSELPMIESAVGHFTQAKHKIGFEYFDYIEDLIREHSYGSSANGTGG